MDNNNISSWTLPPNPTTTQLPDDYESESLMTLETSTLIRTIMGCSLFPLVFLCGTAGNVMTIVVLCYDGLRENVNIVLFALAVSDLCFVVSYYLPLLSHIVEQLDVVLAITLRTLTMTWLVTVSLLFGRISAVFVCFIAAERFILVVFPLRAPTILTKVRIRVTCVMIYVVMVCALIPGLLSFKTGYAFSSVYNVTLPKAVRTEFYYANSAFIKDYVFVYLTIFLRIVPLFFVLILTSTILIALRRSRKWSEQVSSTIDSKRLANERKITKTLLSVCILFIATSTPAVIYSLMLFNVPGFTTAGKYKNTVNVVYAVISLLEMINSSANFVLYVTTSVRFSTTFKRVFCISSKNNSSTASASLENASTTTTVHDG